MLMNAAGLKIVRHPTALLDGLRRWESNNDPIYTNSLDVPLWEHFRRLVMDREVSPNHPSSNFTSLIRRQVAYALA